MLLKVMIAQHAISGSQIDVRIPRTPDGASRGIGFATLASKEDCDKIIEVGTNFLSAECPWPFSYQHVNTPR